MYCNRLLKLGIMHLLLIVASFVYIFGQLLETPFSRVYTFKLCTMSQLISLNSLSVEALPRDISRNSFRFSILNISRNSFRFSILNISKNSFRFSILNISRKGFKLSILNISKNSCRFSILNTSKNSSGFQY